MNGLKILLIFTGTLFFGIGIIGIVVPGLPTTPFLLLSAALFMRSSKKLYHKFISIKWVGNYLSRFYHNKGLTKREKISAIFFMWSMIALSCFFFIKSVYMQAVVIVLGVIGTIVMVFFLPTISK